MKRLRFQLVGDGYPRLLLVGPGFWGWYPRGFEISLFSDARYRASETIPSRS